MSRRTEKARVSVVYVPRKSDCQKIEKLARGGVSNKYVNQRDIEKVAQLSSRFKTQVKTSVASVEIAPEESILVDVPSVQDKNGQQTAAPSSIYTFKTSKRRNQLQNFAAEHMRQQNGEGTKKSKRRQVKVVNDSEDDDDVSEESDEEDDHLNQNQTAVMPVAGENELYFRAQDHAKSGTTSNHTLKNLKGRRLNREEVADALSTMPRNEIMKKIDVERKKLAMHNKSAFDEWMFYLHEDYNILLYGLGSKRNLIHSFGNRMISGADKLVINGFFPRASIKSILMSICSQGIKLESHPLEVEEMCKLVCQHYSQPEHHIYLLVHNIDGTALRAQRTQSVLSRLAATCGIHIVASIDHINASLIWEQRIALNFNWLSFDATTFEPYSEETNNECSMALASGQGVAGGGLVLSGLLHVTESLTRNARACFRILVEDQLEGGEGDANEGMSFSELYRRCREKFIVNSELTLRAHLTEFIDHKLLTMRKNQDGGDSLHLALSRATLCEYLEHGDA